ncbi:EamA family transporter [Pseudonocardia acaciae]|uniref:EamA family transporter n=1 Tax=Pseudonocardia acaciae TaxID=551276 RepID=UPI00048E1867|nr:EamA family transporter [Pseudonocardia acaciae]
MTVRDRLAALLVVVLWGGNFLAMHIALEHFPPLLLAAVRFLVIAVPTVLLVPRPNVRWRWLVGYGFFFGTAQFPFLFMGMKLGLPTGLASLVLQAAAPFTVLLGAVLLRERLARRQVTGVLLAVGGLAAIAVARSAVAPALPLVLGLLAALSWAFGNLCSRRADPAEPMRFMLWMSVVPPVPLFALSLAVEGPGAMGEALASAVTPGGWAGLAALGYLVLCATVLGLGVWTALLTRYPAGTVAPYCMLVPVVGMGLAALVLGERPSWVELVAGAVIVGGVLLGTPRPPRPRARTEEGAAERAIAEVTRAT